MFEYIPVLIPWSQILVISSCISLSLSQIQLSGIALHTLPPHDGALQSQIEYWHLSE